MATNGLPPPIPTSPYGGHHMQDGGPLRNVMQPPSWIGRRVFPVTLLMAGATFLVAGPMAAIGIGALHYFAMQNV
jgi:hypothetical protein